jgi:hypothetical protein
MRYENFKRKDFKKCPLFIRITVTLHITLCAVPQFGYDVVHMHNEQVALFLKKSAE